MENKSNRRANISRYREIRRNRYRINGLGAHRLRTDARATHFYWYPRTYSVLIVVQLHTNCAAQQSRCT